MKSAKILAAALLVGSATLASNAPAVSAPLIQDSRLKASIAEEGAETVQFRRGYRGGWRGGQRFRNEPRFGYRGGFRRGPSAGAVIGGLAAGAIIGGAIANSQAQAAGNANAYCSQRYRSYDPASGTYLNYDGNRYPCP